MPYARADDGTPLFYERFGAGAGQTILLIMGLGANGRIWRPVVSRLVDNDYDVLTFDNRGCGRSGVPMRPWTTKTMAADAIAVADAAGVGELDLIGASLGGMVAQEVAIAHPRRIRKLILGCTTGGLSPLGVLPPRVIPGVVGQLLPTLRGPASTHGAVRAFLRFACSAEFAAACDERSDAWRAVAEALDDPTTSRGLAHQMVAAVRHSTWSRLARLTMPVQVQHGSADRLIPVDSGRELARRIPRARLEILDGAGHALGLERPAETVDRAVAFLESRSRVRS